MKQEKNIKNKNKTENKEEQTAGKRQGNNFADEEDGVNMRKFKRSENKVETQLKINSVHPAPHSSQTGENRKKEKQ